MPAVKEIVFGLGNLIISQAVVTIRHLLKYAFKINSIIYSANMLFSVCYMESTV